MVEDFKVSIKSDSFIKSINSNFLLHGINILISICIMFSFYKVHYSNDYYAQLYSDYVSQAKFACSLGRFSVAIYDLLFEFFKIDINSSIFLNNTVYILLMDFCTILLLKYFIKFSQCKYSVKEIFLIDFSLLIAFINIFSAEWFNFTGGLIPNALGILASILAVVFFLHGGMYYCLSFLVLFIAYNTYQIFISYFVFFGLFFLYLKENKIIRTSIIKLFIAFLLCLLCFLVNYILLKIFSVSQHYTIGNLSTIVANIKKIFWHQKLLWFYGNGITNAPDLLLFFLLLIFFIIFLVVKSKNLLKDVFAITIISLGGLAVLYVPQILRIDFWPGPRTFFPFFSIFSILIIFIVINLSNKKKFMFYFLFFVTVFFLTYMAIKSNRYATDIANSNLRDKNYFLSINEKIAEYEYENNTTVKCINFINDKYPHWRWEDNQYSHWKNIDYGWDLCVSALPYSWCVTHAYNFYTKKNYLNTEVPNDILEVISSSNWDEVNLREQIFFRDENVYVAVY